MVVSVVQSIGIFFLLGRSKLVVSIVFALSRDIFLLRNMSWKQVRSNGLNMADLPDRKIEEDKTYSMLWLDFNNILKILIGGENM